MADVTCDYETRYAVLHVMPLGVCIFDADYVVRLWNKCLESWTKIPSSKIVGRSLFDFFPQLQQPRFTSRFEPLFQNGPPVIFSARLHGSIIPSFLPGGIVRLQHTVARALKEEDGLTSILMTMQDVTEAHMRLRDYSQMHDKALHEIEMRQKAEAVLRESEERFASAFEYAANGMALVALDGRFLKANHALCAMLGYSKEDVLNQTLQACMHPEDVESDNKTKEQLVQAKIESYQQEVRLFTSAHQLIWVHLSVSLVRDNLGQALYFIAQIKDITERKQLEHELQVLATTDHLTGISNRRDFLLRAEKELVRCQRRGFSLGFLMIDIDRFKTINDTWGHGAGDEVLKAMVTASQNILRTFDVLGRLGGEEFGVVLMDVGQEEALFIAERLRIAMNNVSVRTEYAEIRFTVSIGLAHYSGGVTVIEDLMRQADSALYEAKASGRNRVCVAADLEQQCNWSGTL